MINQLINPYNFSSQENNCITSNGNNWYSQSNCIKAIKVLMNLHFDTHQNERCCYCGLLYDRTGRGEIDHIAPQGVNYYPQFSFTSKNLAKACQLCNSSSMKHDFDTIETMGASYDQCSFKIVHPYLDDHNYHYSWRYGLRRVIISVNNDSDKAKESIRIFELASEKRTRARAIERNQERLDRIYNLPIAIRDKIKAVITFK